MIKISTDELNVAQKAIDAIHRSGGLYTSEDVLRAALRAFAEYREAKAAEKSLAEIYSGNQWTDEQIKQHKEKGEELMEKDQDIEVRHITATEIE